MRKYGILTFIVALGLLLGSQALAGKGGGGQSSGGQSDQGQEKTSMAQEQIQDMKQLQDGSSDGDMIRDRDRDRDRINQ